MRRNLFALSSIIDPKPTEIQTGCKRLYKSVPKNTKHCKRYLFIADNVFNRIGKNQQPIQKICNSFGNKFYRAGYKYR